jgi:hypothetical protein
MFLAIAVLLIHPQLAATTPLAVENVAINAPATVSLSSDSTSAAISETTSPVAAASLEAAPQPAAETSAALPDAPLPMPSPTPSAPAAFIKSAKPMTVSVAQLQDENRRKQMLWKGLVIASSGAATFDAWTTRRAISNYGAVELNPLLRPFAGNSSLYAAIQVAPVLLDFAGKKMMYSRNSWLRHAWWVPQSASFVSSIFCGAHNLGYR